MPGDDGVRKRKEGGPEDAAASGPSGSTPTATPSGDRSSTTGARTPRKRGGGSSSSSSVFLFVPLFFLSLLAASAIASLALATTAPPPPGTIHTVGHFGQTLHVHCMGPEDGEKSSGSLAVLLHGSLTEGGSSSFFIPLMLRLRSLGHRSCAVDRPGHGFSAVFQGSDGEYAGRRSRVAAAEAVEALVAAGELEEIVQDVDPDAREFKSRRGGRVAIVGFGTGAYVARFMSRIVLSGKGGANREELQHAPTVLIEPATPSSPLFRTPHGPSRESLAEVLHIFSYLGATRWATMLGFHPMLHSVSKADPTLRMLFEEEISAPGAHAAEIASHRNRKDIAAEVRAELTGYADPKRGKAGSKSSIPHTPEGRIMLVIVGESATDGAAGDADIRDAVVADIKTHAQAVGAKFTRVPGARRLVMVDEPSRTAAEIGAALSAK